MTNDKVLTVVNAEIGAAAEYTQEQVDLIKTTIAKNTTDAELALFLGTARRLGLDPFARQVYAVKRWDKREGKEVMTVQVSIDGFRAVAERSGQYAGQLGPFWCGEDCEWFEIWVGPNPPMAAKVGVLRHDFKEPLWAIAKWDSYAQYGKDGKPTHMWRKFPELMLGKCAEALALRRAFPQHLSGVYSSYEMAQANTTEGKDAFAIQATQAKQIAAPPAAEVTSDAQVTVADLKLGHPKCKGKTKTGRACGRTPNATTGYCSHHVPEVVMSDAPMPTPEEVEQHAEEDAAARAEADDMISDQRPEPPPEEPPERVIETGKGGKRVLDLMVSFNGRPLFTAGITSEQLLEVWKARVAYDEMFEKGAALATLKEGWGLEHSNHLTKKEAIAYISLLDDAREGLKKDMEGRRG